MYIASVSTYKMCLPVCDGLVYDVVVVFMFDSVFICRLQLTSVYSPYKKNSFQPSLPLIEKA